MVGVVESARLLWCSGLSSLKSKPAQGMQEWLSTATYAPAISGSAIELTGVDVQNLLSALAFDINRSTSAASETLRNIVEVSQIPKSSAWHFVKIYYASLFYAHAMLRIWGRSPSYIRTSDLLSLRSALNAYGLSSPYKLQTGQFILRAQMAVPAVSIEADKGGGGTHEAIWREFFKALNDLRTAVQSAPFLSSDKQDIDSRLVVASDLISNKGANVSWLSMMRNEIQYRQGYGLWFPYGGKIKSSNLQADVQHLLSKSFDVQTILISGGGDIERFWAACSTVIWLVRSVLGDMDSVAGAKGFLRYGQSRFELSLKTAKVAA